MTGEQITARGATSWPLPYLAIGGVGIALSSTAINSWELAAATMMGLVVLRRILAINVLPIALIWLYPLLELTLSVVDAEGQSLTLAERFYGTGREAFWYGFVGLCGLYAGWWLLWRRRSQASVMSIEDELVGISLRRILIVHIVFLLGAQLIDSLIPYGSSIAQLTVHLNKAPLFILYLAAWRYQLKRQEHLLFWGVVVYNVAVSLASFFSEWREFVILFAFIGLIQPTVPSLSKIRRLAVIAFLGLFAVTTWQAVKQEYRSFISGETDAQVVRVSQSEALEYLLELSKFYWLDTGEIETTKNQRELLITEDVGQATLERVGYLDFFARMMQYVPDEIPHEDGKLLKGNLSFALIPRILNPNKGVKDDQWKVEYYTKRIISDNSSFSLGHFAEHYVDFGPLGMVFSLFIFGIFGAILSFQFTRGQGLIAAVDLIALFSILSLYVSFQADAIKIYGQCFWGAVVYLVITRRAIVYAIERYLIVPKAESFIEAKMAS